MGRLLLILAFCLSLILLFLPIGLIEMLLFATGLLFSELRYYSQLWMATPLQNNYLPLWFCFSFSLKELGQ
jgi:hypothetical protein